MKIEKKILLFIVAVTAVKVICLLVFNIQPQTFENTSIAHNYIADGQMYYRLDGNIDYNHQFPFFGWILIGFFKLFGEVLLPVQLFQIIVNGCFAYLVWRVFDTQFRNTLGKKWMAVTLVLLALLHPLLVHYQFTTIHPVTLDVFLFAALMYTGLVWQKSPSLKVSLILVLVVGITLLERSTLAVAILPAFILALKDKILFFKLIGISSIAILLFAGPWMVRNHNLTGKYEMTSGTWRYLWVGIQAATDGTNVLANGNSYYALFPPEVANEWSNKSLAEQLGFYKEAYLQEWDDSPMRIIEMWGVKLKNMFWFSKISAGNYHGHILYALYNFFHAVVLILFVVGFFSKERKSILLLFSGAILLAVLQAFFYVETRHAMPFQFILWIGALQGVNYLIFGLFKNNRIKELSLKHGK